MAYCWKCGVEIAKSQERCPLCGTGVPSEHTTGELISATSQAFEEIRRIEETLEQPGQKRKAVMAAVLVTAIFLIPALILLSIARFRETTLGWALYPLFSLTVSWAAVVFLMFFHRHPRMLTLIYAALAPSALLWLDSRDNSLDWFWSFGVPILGSLYALILATAFVVIKMLKNRFYRTAAVLFAVGIFVVALEAILNFRILGVLKLSWSLICSSALFPTGAFLVILSFLLRSNPDLRKIFRI